MNYVEWPHPPRIIEERAESEKSMQEQRMIIRRNQMALAKKHRVAVAEIGEAMYLL